jgi:DnaA family protein
MTQLLLDLEPPARPRFDNFIAGRNGEALAAVRRLCEMPSADHAQRFIYLWGDAGSGRSHLLQAAAAWVHGHCLDGSTVGADDVNTMIAAEDVDTRRVLIVDDVESTDAATQEALFHAYNALRADPRGAMIVAGDRAPRDLALHADRDDLRSRLAWGLAYQLQRLDDDEKDAALVRHAEQRGFPLAPEVRRYLMTHFARDLGSLMQMVEALDRHAREQRRVVTLPLIRDFLQRDVAASLTSAH